MSNISCNLLSGLPRLLSGKELTCQCRRHGFVLGVRKIAWRRTPPVLMLKETARTEEPGGPQCLGPQRAGHDCQLNNGKSDGAPHWKWKMEWFGYRMLETCGLFILLIARLSGSHAAPLPASWESISLRIISWENIQSQHSRFGFYYICIACTPLCKWKDLKLNHRKWGTVCIIERWGQRENSVYLCS